MAFTRPTLATLRTQMRDRITSEMASAGFKVDATIPRTLLRILADTFAGALHVLYGAVSSIARQILPDIADTDYLERHAAIYAITRQPAEPWAGDIIFTGVNTTAIPEGTTVTSATGAVYTTTAAGVIAMGVATIAAEAEVAGAAGNLADGAALTLGEAISGIDSDVEVDSTTTTGTDIETDNELRERVLQRIQDTPQGGSADDYERWAREVSGVNRSLAVPLARGAGTVDVYFLHDLGTGYGIPTSPQITEVQTYIDERRPVTADVDVLAPSTTTQAYTFAALSPNDAATQAAIEDELDAMYRTKALRSLADGTPEPVYVSDHWQAIAAAAGVVSFDLTTPSATLTPTAGQVYIRGAMTYP